MFQSIRPNSTIYILHKGDNPRLEIGYVTNQPIPKPRYQVPAAFNNQENVVDLIVKVNGQISNYNGIPVNLDIADTFCNGESVTISDTKEAMNAEIISLKQKSSEILNSIDYHKKMIDECDRILTELNPEFAEKQAQQEEINSMKTQMNEMAKQMTELMETNRTLIAKLSKEK